MYENKLDKLNKKIKEKKNFLKKFLFLLVFSRKTSLWKIRKLATKITGNETKASHGRP